MISGLAHTGVCVPNLEEAVQWYTQTLGLVVLSPPARIEGRAIEADMGEMIPGIVVLAAAILGVHDSGDRVLEVIEYPNHPGQPKRQGWSLTDHGFSHVGVVCDDIAATRAQLEARGVRFLTGGTAEIAGLKTSWFEDPYGNVFILMEKRASQRPYFRQWAATDRERRHTVTGSSSYTPPRVWKWEAESGGRFAKINRPIAGATHEKELPVGQHPLQLYSLATPNGVKVTVLLEELLAIGKDAEYDAYLVNIGSGDSVRKRLRGRESELEDPGAARSQHDAADARLRVGSDPALPGREVRRIRAHAQPSARAECLSWLFWQMGATPFLGGGFGHFYAYAPEKLEYPINRYAMEAKRQLDVLDRNLADRRFLVGNEYTIADMATWPWYGGLVLHNLYDAAGLPRREVVQARGALGGGDPGAAGRAPRRAREQGVGTRRAARTGATFGPRSGLRSEDPMAISFYDMSVGTYLQTLGAVSGFLAKGRAHCEANGIELKEVVEMRLYPDMNPFRFQLFAVAHLSLGALKGLEAGRFSPPGPVPELDFAGLQQLVADAHGELAKVSRESADALENTQVTFQIGDFKMPFTATNFVLSFSLPNVFFHATTAYDMLRMKGVPLGKIDFLGQMRIGV